MVRCKIKEEEYRAEINIGIETSEICD